jgi:hypothetical protein
MNSASGSPGFRFPAMEWTTALAPRNRVRIALNSLLLWLALLIWAARLPVSGMGLLAAEAILLFWLMRSRANPVDRPVTELLFALALLVYTLEIFLVQSLPAWSDEFPDSHRYDVNARALILHWRGQTVPAADFLLKGLLRQGIDAWLPDADYDYATVLGMGRYAYQLLLAGIYAMTDGSRMTAILANVPLLAGMAAGVYLLSLDVFGRRAGAGLAALLVILDTNFAVWGSVLLRESLMEFLVVLSFLSGVRLLKPRDRRWRELLPGGIALSLLAMVRFNAAGALLVAWGCAAVFSRPRRSTLTRFAIGAIVLALVGYAAPRFVPGLESTLENSLPARIIQENLRILQQGGQILESAVQGRQDAGERVNDVRREWHDALRTQPLWLNALKAITRTLMGPYPWVALTHGIKGDDFYELMYPGMTLWLLCLPAFFHAIRRLPVVGDPVPRFFLVWWVTVASIYIVGYGQFGGRERMMAMPLLWTFAAEGLRLAWSRAVGRASA